MEKISFHFSMYNVEKWEGNVVCYAMYKQEKFDSKFQEEYRRYIFNAKLSTTNEDPGEMCEAAATLTPQTAASPSPESVSLSER